MHKIRTGRRIFRRTQLRRRIDERYSNGGIQDCIDGRRGSKVVSMEKSRKPRKQKTEERDFTQLIPY